MIEGARRSIGSEADGWPDRVDGWLVAGGWWLVVGESREGDRAWGVRFECCPEISGGEGTTRKG